MCSSCLLTIYPRLPLCTNSWPLNDLFLSSFDSSLLFCLWHSLDSKQYFKLYFLQCCMQNNFSFLVLWGTPLLMWCRPDCKFLVKFPANCHLLFSFGLHVLQFSSLNRILVLQIKIQYHSGLFLSSVISNSF